MRRNVARIGRLLLAVVLAYLTVGIVWQTAFELALTRSATSDIPPPWEGLMSFLAWFVLPSALWPWSMAEFIPGGLFIAIALFAGMTALMFAALARLAPGSAAVRTPRRPRRRSQLRSAGGGRGQ